MVVSNVASRSVDGSKNHLSTQSKASVIILISLFSLTSFPLATIGGGSSASNTCSVSNGLCGPIAFISSQFGNATSASTITTNSWSAIGNQSMVVIASIGGSLTRGTVSSVSDLQNDKFSMFLQQQSPGATGFPDLEVWFGHTTLIGINAVTINWNASENVLGQVIVYDGVTGLGAKNSTFQNGAQAPTPSLTLTTSQSGSWIDGILSLSAPNLCTGSMISSPKFVDRQDGCASTGCGFDCYPVTTSIADNATALRNTVKLAYVPAQDASATDLRVAEFALLPSDLEPATPDFNIFCTISPFNCPTHMNIATANSRPNALGKGLALNTAYCTGITTSGLTVSTVGPALIWAAYSADDLNTTSAKIFLQLYISTNIPSTSFGVGLCATGGTISATGTIFFPLNGALSLTNSFTTALNGLSSSLVAGTTYYAWIEVTAQGFGAGSLGMDQLCTNVSFGLCSLQIQEIK